MGQEQKEIDKIIDDTFLDQSKFLKITESMIKQLSNDAPKYNAYSKTKINSK